MRLSHDSYTSAALPLDAWAACLSVRPFSRGTPLEVGPAAEGKGLCL